jgi:hypothetical protein
MSANDPQRSTRRLSIYTATNVLMRSLDHLVGDGEQRRRDGEARIVGKLPQTASGILDQREDVAVRVFEVCQQAAPCLTLRGAKPLD